MNDTLKKINLLLAKFNQTFDIEANIVDDTTDTLMIKGLKNDGKEFMSEMFDIFAKIVKQSSADDYELVYDIHYGLALAKKKIVVEYELEKQPELEENASKVEQNTEETKEEQDNEPAENQVDTESSDED